MSYGHIMYTAKMCHNSVLGDRNVLHNYFGTNCLPCQLQLSNNVLKIMVFVTSLTILPIVNAVILY